MDSEEKTAPVREQLKWLEAPEELAVLRLDPGVQHVEAARRKGERCKRVHQDQHGQAIG